MTATVLIYDDEPTALEYHVKSLRDHGYAVRMVETEAEGHRVMWGEEREFHLLILDMMMPAPKEAPAAEVEEGRRTGRWFLQTYRQHCDIGTPVLLLSRLDGSELLDAAWGAYCGWRRLMGKPEPDSTLTADQKRKKLEQDFKVLVREKRSTRADQMPDVVKSIIRK